MALSNNVLLVMIFILFAALMLNIFFGCRSIQEGFEAKEMTEEAITAIKDMDPNKAAELVQKMLKEKGVLSKSSETDKEETDDEEEPEEEESKPQKKESATIVKDMLKKAKESSEETRPLTQKEMELFEAISKDQVSNEDLEKLVKAGIITEGLVERFLSTLQDDVSTKTDEVVEGFSCQRDFATF